MAPNPPRFNSLLKRWKKKEDKIGATPFAVTGPKKNKSKIAMQNEDAIREYKKTFKTKNFKTKTPTRGMSVYNKPAQLQNVFGATVEDLSKYKSPKFEKSDDSVKTLREGIGKNFFFDDMSPQDLAAFVNAFEPFEVAKGSTIIKQGEKGDYFYVIEEGQVTFHVDGEKHSEANKGDSFGEIALLYKCPRAATVAAETEPTKLFRVDQKTFRSLLQKQTKILNAKKMELLRSVDFLKEIDEIDMKRLGAAMTPKNFEPGDCLVKKGDEGDAFYMIKEGEMQVTDISVGSTKFDDVILKEGNYFGERALATKEPRAANVTATTKGTAFYIDQATFEKILGKFSRVIMKAQDRRIMVSVSSFDCLPACEIS
jgi:cAMP-dependent protein kinase regulator